MGYKVRQASGAAIGPLCPATVSQQCFKMRLAPMACCAHALGLGHAVLVQSNSMLRAGNTGSAGLASRFETAMRLRPAMTGRAWLR